MGKWDNIFEHWEMQNKSKLFEYSNNRFPVCICDYFGLFSYLYNNSLNITL